MSRKSCLMMIAIAISASCLPSAAQAQLFFETDWLYMDRDHDAGGSFITGPEQVAPGAVNYDFEPGYRFIGGGDFFSWRIDGSYTQLDSWSGFQSGTLTAPLVLDENAGNAFVTGGVVPSNSIGLKNVLAPVTRNPLEILEGEFLQPGAFYTVQSSSDYRDWEINVGTSQVRRRWRASVGYRNIALDEANRLTFRGNFDALDAADGNTLGVENNGLSDAALTAAGLTLISGAADGYNNIAVQAGMAMPPAVLSYQALGTAENDLDGAQVTLVGRIYDGDWVTLEGIVKAGIYRNSISARVRETVAGSGGDDSVYFRQFTDKHSKAAFAGNLGLRAIWSLTDYVNLTGGYELLWIDGVALGPDQQNGITTSISGVTSLRAQADGSMFAHGANLGLEVLW